MKTICENFLKVFNSREYSHSPESDDLKCLPPEIESLEQNNCWHAAIFDKTTQESDADLPVIKSLSWRLNNVLINKLPLPATNGFSTKQLLETSEKEIEFLKNYEISPVKFPYTPAMLFGCSTFCRVETEQDAQIIRNAVLLDCSKIAEESILLYRGANDLRLKESTIYNDSNKSVSFGTSLFAGSSYDQGTMPFFYAIEPARKKVKKELFVTPVPIREVTKAPFYIPPGGCFPQLFGEGEMYHARSKVWNGANPRNISGIFHIYPSARLSRDFLISDLGKNALRKSLESYQKKSIKLKEIGTANDNASNL